METIGTKHIKLLREHVIRLQDEIRNRPMKSKSAYFSSYSPFGCSIRELDKEGKDKVQDLLDKGDRGELIVGSNIVELDNNSLEVVKNPLRAYDDDTTVHLTLEELEQLVSLVKLHSAKNEEMCSGARHEGAVGEAYYNAYNTMFKEEDKGDE